MLLFIYIQNKAARHTCELFIPPNTPRGRENLATTKNLPHIQSWLQVGGVKENNTSSDMNPFHYKQTFFTSGVRINGVYRIESDEKNFLYVAKKLSFNILASFFINIANY